MITTEEQFKISLHQLSSFEGMLEAMRLHLQETEPTLIPLISESYIHRIQEIQTEIRNADPEIKRELAERREEKGTQDGQANL